MERVRSVRAVLGKAGPSKGAGGSVYQCYACGSANTRGHRCPSCAILATYHGSHSTHECGGCGSAFVVNSHAPVEPVTIGGIRRVFCACCIEFLGDRLPSSNRGVLLGYDEEGKDINVRFPRLTPSEKRKHRGAMPQIHLEKILRWNSYHPGVRQTAPLFIEL